MTHLLKRFVNYAFIQFWWVFAFVLVTGIVYEQGSKAPDALFTQFTDQKNALLKQKRENLERQKNLQLQINSQSDLDWIELTLIKGLGLVPEGYQKVYFHSDNP